MTESVTQATYLKDYRPPDFLIDETHLSFELEESSAVVSACLMMRRNPDGRSDAVLELDGCGVELLRLAINGRELDEREYRIADNKLFISSALPVAFELESDVRINPHLNKSLEGLYKSRKMFCTQCEAEGFRKITYYLDRPDVMSIFTVKITAEKQRYPVLLSNGNLIESGDLDDGRHLATWRDPFKKPGYLFALVAGDLQFVEDYFVTCTGRNVLLRIYVEEKDLTKCDHAMRSLKNAMAWDEKKYGREYDLDIYMIVAVDDFNMGAMENKGLNIFNTSCVLASPDITTDKGFQRVESVIAHEYFHNWSGNRVTCRDWFQLSLKEGFTVFRDSCFSADMGSPVVNRVEEVNLLRTSQFAEDAGPMAHPVQPPSYIEISNFYTATVYEKGSEVVRMLSLLLGDNVFRRGTDIYFDRHDGQAVTIEEFIKAMEDASGRDLAQFRRWYTQAGTPVLTVHSHYDEQEKTFVLGVAQSCLPTPEAEHKKPFHIPLAMGLLGEAGCLPLQLRGNTNYESPDNTNMVLEVTDVTQTYVFENVLEKPVPSLLRGFSAPVKLIYSYTRDELVYLMSHDSDGFNRWEGCQQLGMQILLELSDDVLQKKPLYLDEGFVEAYKILLSDEHCDASMAALMLDLPNELYIAEQMPVVHTEAIHEARLFARKTLAQELKFEFTEIYSKFNTDRAYQPIAFDMGERNLKNTALSYLMLLNDCDIAEQCLKQFKESTNMTDRIAALSALINCNAGFVETVRSHALEAFYQQWQKEPLAVNLWLQLQATSRLPGALARVYDLLKHPAFDMSNPNKVRAVIGAFSVQNPLHFHAKDGSGYKFLAEKVVELDVFNPQIAARLLMPLTQWKHMPPSKQDKMRAELQRILNNGPLSTDVFEVVSKSV